MAPSHAELFIDTGAFIARYDADDQYHAAAVAAWAELAPPASRWRLVTSGVLGETFTLLGRRAGFPFAAKVARAVLDSPSISIRWGDPETAGAALTFFTKLADPSVRWVDCGSFALMRSGRISRAFTFDRYFDDAGFHRWNG